MRITEAFTGRVMLQNIELSGDTELLFPPERPERLIEFIGNSITCGYGNEGADKTCPFTAETENGYEAYGARAARQLGAAYRAICYSGRGCWRNYDGTHEGNLYELYQRIDIVDSTAWQFEDTHPQAVVINLGTNDFARGIPDSASFVGQYIRLARLYVHIIQTQPSSFFQALP